MLLSEFINDCQRELLLHGDKEVVMFHDSIDMFIQDPIHADIFYDAKEDYYLIS